jgi:Dinucleotide-utilizing enzymes involved in molybdopterin and thiamine biosynthesis family 2
MRFAGECPCDENGVPIGALRPNPAKLRIGDKLTTDFEFSNKATGGYRDHYVKVVNYAGLISGPAANIDHSLSPLTFKVVEPEPDESPFHYLDTASAGASISIIAKKLGVEKIAIVGLGGTGSYVLDLIAKTPVKEIHLYDADKFSSHNAFRAPGAAPRSEVRAQRMKVEYFHDIYSKMHRGIVAHTEHIDEGNVGGLVAMDCVFLCMDSGPGKRLIVDSLAKANVPFIDVGMGLISKDETLRGILQVVTSTPNNRVQARSRMALGDTDAPNEYDKNIQVSDLNALNATLAVLKWKKMRGFYVDSNHANFQIVTIRSTMLLNSDGDVEDK